MDFKYTFSDGFTPGEIQDISKCLGNILNIPKGSLPLARGLGVDWANLSQIPADMENDYATEAIEKIERYEPRVNVADVEFCYDGGMAIAKITLEKGDGIYVNS